MAIAARVDALQRRHPRLSFPLAVIYKFVDDQGSYLSALIAYYGFLSLFPLLLLLSSILGFVLKGDPGLQHRILHSALGQFPVIGNDLGSPKRLSGNGIALTVGILGSLYGGLGVAQAGQHAMNTAWAVPRNLRPNPLKARGRSLLLLATVGAGVLLTTVISALGSSAGAFGAQFGIWVKIGFTVISVALNVGLFLLGFKIATAADVSFKSLLPGALTAAIGWQVLQSFGAAYVGHVVKNASATNSVFALVLGLIAWIYLGSVIVLLSVEINVVRDRRLYPRALLTPFTDDVVLTAGDERVYTDAAKAQRNKGFEEIDVAFHPDPPDQTALFDDG
jgi:YihY family inner membrane protein